MQILEDTVRTYDWLYEATDNEAYRVARDKAAECLYEALRASETLKEVA